MPPIVLAALLQIADAAPPPRRSSADDCAIMALAGKEKLGWGTERPRYSFSGNTYRDGNPTFVVTCAWEEFGVVPPEPRGGKPVSILDLQPSISGGVGRVGTRIVPRPSMAAPNASSSITPPIYESSGLHASVSVNIMSWRSAGATVQSWSCNFFRYAGVWNLSGCKDLPAIKSN